MLHSFNLLTPETSWFRSHPRFERFVLVSFSTKYLLHLIGWINRDWTNESSDLFYGIIRSRQDTNHDENVVFDEIPDHRSRTSRLWIRPQFANKVRELYRCTVKCTAGLGGWGQWEGCAPGGGPPPTPSAWLAEGCTGHFSGGNCVRCAAADTTFLIISIKQLHTQRRVSS